jgi:hypothetical protein
MLFLFKSTRDVMAAEKIIRAAAIPCRMVPIPRSISSECGMGIKIDPEYADAASSLLKDFDPVRHEE